MERNFPHGRIGPDDDGEIEVAIAADVKHRKVRIQFSHPTAWVALGEVEAKLLRAALDKKIAELWPQEIPR